MHPDAARDSAWAACKARGSALVGASWLQRCMVHSAAHQSMAARSVDSALDSPAAGESVLVLGQVDCCKVSLRRQGGTAHLFAKSPRTRVMPQGTPDHPNEGKAQHAVHASMPAASAGCCSRSQQKGASADRMQHAGKMLRGHQWGKPARVEVQAKPI